MFIQKTFLTRLFWFLIPLLALYDNDPPTMPPAPPPPAPPNLPPTPPADPAAGVQALIARHNNDLMRVIDHLYSDNYNLREKNRTLKEQVKDLEGKTPKDGGVILSKAEADLLESYKAVGDVETVKTALGERDQLKGELGVLRKDGVLRDVAEAAGFKLPVLKTLAGDLQFEIKEIDQDGKKVRTAFVKNGDGEKPVADYAKEKWADFLPALTAQPPQSGGTPFPSQSAGGPPSASSVLADFKKKSQEQRAAQPNPLAK